MKPEEEENPAVKAAEATAADRGDDDDVFTEPKDRLPEDVGTILDTDHTRSAG